MITRTCNVLISQGRVSASTQNDERVDVDPPVPAEADLDRVGGDLREGCRPGNDATPVDRSAQADRGPIDAVDVDLCGSAGGPERSDECHATTRERCPRPRSGG